MDIQWLYMLIGGLGGLLGGGIFVWLSVQQRIQQKEQELREGYEFDTQVNIKSENSERFQPDVIVHLPQGKESLLMPKCPWSLMNVLSTVIVKNNKHNITRTYQLHQRAYSWPEPKRLSAITRIAITGLCFDVYSCRTRLFGCTQSGARIT